MKKCGSCRSGYGRFPLRGKLLCAACWRTAIGGEPAPGQCSACRAQGKGQPCLAHRGTQEVKLTEQTLLAELDASMRRYDK